MFFVNSYFKNNCYFTHTIFLVLSSKNAVDQKRNADVLVRMQSLLRFAHARTRKPTWKVSNYALSCFPIHSKELDKCRSIQRSSVWCLLNWASVTVSRMMHRGCWTNVENSATWFWAVKSFGTKEENLSGTGKQTAVGKRFSFIVSLFTSPALSLKANYLTYRYRHALSTLKHKSHSLSPFITFSAF